jgi:flagellin-specific chaperone FliS
MKNIVNKYIIHQNAESEDFIMQAALLSQKSAHHASNGRQSYIDKKFEEAAMHFENCLSAINELEKIMRKGSQNKAMLDMANLYSSLYVAMQAVFMKKPEDLLYIRALQFITDVSKAWNEVLERKRSFDQSKNSSTQENKIELTA